MRKGTRVCASSSVIFWPRSSPVPRGSGETDGPGESWILTPRSPSQPATARLAVGDNASVPESNTTSATRAAATGTQTGWNTGRRTLREGRSLVGSRGGAEACRRRLPTRPERSGKFGKSTAEWASTRIRSRAGSGAVGPVRKGILSQRSAIGRSFHLHALAHPGGAHDVTEAGQGPGEPRLHRPSRAAEGVGHLGLGQVEPVAVRDDQAILGSEPVHGPDQAPVLVLREGRPLRRWDRIVLEAALGSPERQANLPPRRSAPVDGLVRHDAEEPGTEGRAAAEPAQRVVGLDEGLLNGILGIGGPSGDHVGGPGGKVLVGPYELFVCGHVAMSRPFDEFLFLQWSAPHGEISLHVRPRLVDGSWSSNRQVSPAVRASPPRRSPLPDLFQAVMGEGRT